MSALEGPRKYFFYIALTLLTALFLMGGVTKLMGAQQVVDTFNHFGLPLTFMYFIGLCEAAGAIGLWIPKLSVLAAVGLIIVMLGAVSMHFMHDPITAAIPALAALGLLTFVILTRRAT